MSYFHFYLLGKKITTSFEDKKNNKEQLLSTLHSSEFCPKLKVDKGRRLPASNQSLSFLPFRYVSSFGLGSFKFIIHHKPKPTEPPIFLKKDARNLSFNKLVFGIHLLKIYSQHFFPHHNTHHYKYSHTEI